MISHILTFVLRTLLMYFVIYLTLRVMGKREIGKLSIFDLVISIMIAEIAVFVLEDIHRPIYEGIVPMATLLLIQLSIAFVSLKSRKLRLMFEGKPSILVSRGKLHRDEMRKQRYNLDDLLLQLRGQQIENVADVEFAILETSGQLTVIPKSKTSSSRNSGSSPSSQTPTLLAPNQSKARPQTTGQHQGLFQGQSQAQSNGQSQRIKQAAQNRKKSNKKILVPAGKFSYGVLPVPLIMDGKVQDDNLQRLRKTRFWLKNQIQQKGFKEFKDVFLCTIDHKGQVYVDGK